MNKYQRALEVLREGRTWQSIADEMTEVLGQTVYRSDPCNVLQGKNGSKKVAKALVLMGCIPGPTPRFRLACDFESDEHREEFKEFYEIDKDMSFNDWVHATYESDREEARVMTYNL